MGAKIVVPARHHVWMDRDSEEVALCPRCGSVDALPVVYGYPSAELEEAASRGEVALGGCRLVVPGDRFLGESAPLLRCRSCDRYFGYPNPDTRNSPVGDKVFPLIGSPR